MKRVLRTAKTVKLNGKLRNTALSVLFVAPALAFMAAFLAYPIFNVIMSSFTDADNVSTPSFVGLRNYIDLFTNPDFSIVLANNLYFILIGIPVTVIVPLVIAALLYQDIPGAAVFRSIFLLPSVLSIIIVGLLFRTLFAYDGPVNEALAALGLEGMDLPWLAERDTALPVILLAILWAGFGANVIIFFAGMAAIDHSIYESARIDGAGPFRIFFQITVPMMKHVLEFVVVMQMIALLTGMFGAIYSLTGGGPGYETSTLDFFVFLKGFQNSQVGFACAISVVLLVLMVVVAQGIIRFFNRGDNNAV
jgi:multiple sugar transport system permease protein